MEGTLDSYGGHRYDGIRAVPDLRSVLYTGRGTVTLLQSI